MAVGYVFREYMRDLPYTGYDAGTTSMTAMLVKSTWSLDLTITNISAITGGTTNYETTGTGYARVAGFTLVGTSSDLGISFAFNQALTFATLTTTDWQYAVLYNTSSSKPYICIDSQMQNSVTGSTVTLDNTPEPVLQLNLG